jgi:hypothetical protein
MAFDFKNTIPFLIILIGLVTIIALARYIIPQVTKKTLIPVRPNKNTCKTEGILSSGCSSAQRSQYCLENPENNECRAYCLERVSSDGYPFMLYEFCQILTCRYYLPELQNTISCKCNLTDLSTCSQNMCGGNCFDSSLTFTTCEALTGIPYKITSLSTGQRFSVKPFNLNPNQAHYDFNLNSLTPVMPMILPEWKMSGYEAPYVRKSADVVLEGEQLLVNRWSPDWTAYSCATNSIGRKANTFGEYQWLFTKTNIQALWSAIPKNLIQFAYTISYSWFYPLCLKFDPSTTTSALRVEAVHMNANLTYDLKTIQINTSDPYVPGGTVDPAARFIWIVIPISRYKETSTGPPITTVRIFPLVGGNGQFPRLFNVQSLGTSSFLHTCLTESGTKLTMDPVNGSESQLWKIESLSVTECQQDNTTDRALLWSNRTLPSKTCKAPPFMNGNRNDFEIIETISGTSEEIIPTRLFNQGNSLCVIKVRDESIKNKYLFGTFQYSSLSTSDTSDEQLQMVLGYTGSERYSRNVTVGFEGEHGNRFDVCNGPRSSNTLNAIYRRSRCGGYQEVCVWSIIANRLRRVGNATVADLIMKSSFSNYYSNVTLFDNCDVTENVSFMNVWAYPVTIYRRGYETIKPGENGNVFRLYIYRTANTLSDITAGGIWNNNVWDYTLFGWISSGIGESEGHSSCLMQVCEDEIKYQNNLLNSDAQVPSPEIPEQDPSGPSYIGDPNINEANPTKSCVTQCDSCRTKNCNINSGSTTYSFDLTCDGSENFEKNNFCTDIGTELFGKCVDLKGPLCYGGPFDMVYMSNNINNSTPYEFIGLADSNLQHFTTVTLSNNRTVHDNQRCQNDQSKYAFCVPEKTVLPSNWRCNNQTLEGD